MRKLLLISIFTLLCCCAEAMTATKTIYVYPKAWNSWGIDYNLALYSWHPDVIFEYLQEDKDHPKCYKIEVDKERSVAMFVRMMPVEAPPSWDYRWNQSVDINIEGDDDLLIVLDKLDDNGNAMATVTTIDKLSEYQAEPSGPIYHDPEVTTVCDSYTWFGTTYTASGEYTYKVDPDVYTLQLTVYNSTTGSYTEELYEGDHYVKNYFDFIATPGEDTKYCTLTSANGCDSVVMLQLIIHEAEKIVIDKTITQGESFEWRGNTYTEAGTYTDKVLTDLGGTKEIYILNLIVKEPATLAQDDEGWYLIGNVDEWKAFAKLVETSPTVNVKMTADIDLKDDQTRIGTILEGTHTYKYKGVFDGQGHKLNIAYVVSSGKDLAAPFAKVEGATIKNLHITGTVTSTGFHPCSVVADSWGTTTIQNVWSEVDITSTGSGWIEASGLVGCMKGGNLTLTDCLFTGTVNGTGSYNGCFIGYIDSGSATLTNCLSTGTFTYSGGSNGIRGTHINCYIRQFPVSIPADMQVTDEQLADGSIAIALQAERENDVWVQLPNATQPVIVFTGESTGIRLVENMNLANDDYRSDWYTLDGRVLSGKPTRKGVYVSGRRKVIVK